MVSYVALQVGIRKQLPWQMPRGITELRGRCRSMAIERPGGLSKEILGGLLDDEDFKIIALLQGGQADEEDDAQAAQVPFSEAFT